MNKNFYIAGLLIFSIPAIGLTQNERDSLLEKATIDACVQYAVMHYPLIEQSRIDEEITAYEIRSRLAEWYPQVNFNYSFQHNFQVPTSVIGGNPVKLGVNNTSAAALSFSQNIFNRSLLLAQRTQGDVRLAARETTINNKIDIAAQVMKAFYDILATEQQIKVAAENITRLERSIKDAFSQYNAGIADKTDYKRATITLNNTKASKRSNEELLKAKNEYLKSLMGYPVTAPLKIVYDSLKMESEVPFDTLQQTDLNGRIEFQRLQTTKRLQEANLRYEQLSYLPTLSLNGLYNMSYQNDNFGKLYGNNFPNSNAALTLSVPLFQGGKRKAIIKAAELDVSRVNWDIINLRNEVNAQYSAAIANYKSSYANFAAAKENVALAQEVYEVIRLQYRAGIKTYLEVIISETDLRTSQIQYYNALYDVLASKVDARRALGQITVQ